MMNPGIRSAIQQKAFSVGTTSMTKVDVTWDIPQNRFSAEKISTAIRMGIRASALKEFSVGIPITETE